MDGAVLGALAALMECKHGHDKTGRAEAALGGIRVDHGLLHRMKRAVGGGEPLDRQHRATGDLRQHHQTGIDGLILQRPVDLLANDNGTCATIVRSHRRR